MTKEILHQDCMQSTVLAKYLRIPIDVIPLQTPGVYKVDCNCGSSHIGQTKRTIVVWAKERIAAVKKKQQIIKSAVAKHLLISGAKHWIE